MRVAMMRQGEAHCCNRVWGRHDSRWRMVGGGALHQNDIKKRYEIKKQVIGKDPDLEKSGRILNRVLSWNRDGITIEADQRHVREILKGLELARANHSATPCAMEKKDEGKGEHQRGQGRIQTEHERDGVDNSGNRDRPQMADDDDNDSQAFTGGNITRYRALASRISYLSQDRPDLKFASMQVCCAMAKPTMRDMERVKRIGRYLFGKPRARCWFRWQQSGELEAYSDWGGDKTTRRSVSAGVIMRGGHCLKGLDQEAAGRIAVFCRERAVCRSQDRVRGAGHPEHCKGHGNIVWIESAPGSLSNNVPCQPERPGEGKARRYMQNLWIQEASEAGRFVTEEVGTNVNPADLMTKPLAKPMIEQLMGIMGDEFLGIDVDSLEGRSTGV